MFIPMIFLSPNNNNNKDNKQMSLVGEVIFYIALAVLIGFVIYSCVYE